MENTRGLGPKMVLGSPSCSLPSAAPRYANDLLSHLLGRDPFPQTRWGAGVPGTHFRLGQSALPWGESLRPGRQLTRETAREEFVFAMRNSRLVGAAMSVTTVAAVAAPTSPPIRCTQNQSPLALALRSRRQHEHPSRFRAAKLAARHAWAVDMRNRIVKYAKSRKGRG